jgi:hypothetical protein
LIFEGIFEISIKKQIRKSVRKKIKIRKFKDSKRIEGIKVYARDARDVVLNGFEPL